MKKVIIGFLIGAMLSVLCASATAQPRSIVPRVGFLSPRGAPGEGESAFLQGMHDLGFVEGENVILDWRFANGVADQLPRLANELLALKVDVIVVGGRQAALAAKKATHKIPIVIAAAGDPVGAGLAKSLAHPGGNITGLSIDAPGLNGKRLELLKECFPDLSRAAVLYDRAVPGWDIHIREIERSARLLKIRLHPIGVSSEDPSEIERAFAAILRGHDDGLLKLPAAELPSYRQQIVNLAAQKRLPAIYDDKQMTEAGGLMSYGTDVPHLYRRAAFSVTRILKDLPPENLPIEQPTKFELVINLKAAKQIGLTVPPNVLARADRVIR